MKNMRKGSRNKQGMPSEQRKSDTHARRERKRIR